ncbi:dicarboxylate transporter/tellurite-resistance protein TehA [Burkholderia sp. PAMC 26561]|uniref:dicarboxylate transporter/tellurite-resistance protein TehA n=1 Tax=Burkholderia sp. PAMC 26561 TaxID=1795043 RepID=UPI00076AEB8D|nr:dicarboxylate transporter/tellurite-resistance protein TehA [Burkholderia sp. PAMC 26561]AME27858.1 tellurite resistance protein TehA [Burkholderia sp. PAMC 26561]
MSEDRVQMPVAFFGIVVGVLASANAWDVAVRVWRLPADFAVALSAIGIALWLFALARYSYKWLRHTREARSELLNPVQSSFAALVPVSSLLASMALLPYGRTIAAVIFAMAVVAQVVLGIYLHGKLWQGSRRAALITPAIYLPTVAPNFVTATAAAAFGLPQVGMLFFGVGLFFWIAIESLVLHRAMAYDSLPDALRPTLGIQIAPAAVGGVAYMSLTSGVPDIFAHMLMGYGLYQALLLVRLLPWIRGRAFTASYWSFSFGVAALPTLAMRLVERGSTGVIEWLAEVLFVAANLIVGALMVMTLKLLTRGRLMSSPASPSQILREKTSAQLARDARSY